MMHIRWVGWLVLAGLFSSCAQTYPVRKVEPSGFLEDYSQLQPGQTDEARLVYYNPDANILDYDKILIDPVVGYIGEGSRLNQISPKDRQTLLNYFHATLREQLGQDYTLVEQPGPGVLRLRVAVVDAKASKVVMDTVSTVVPVGLAISALERVALGKTLTAGSVQIEAEALDTQTGMRIGAIVDERVGSKLTGHFDKWSKWQDCRDAFDFWAARLRHSMQSFRENLR
jgi:hypothetical protein